MTNLDGILSIAAIAAFAVGHVLGHASKARSWRNKADSDQIMYSRGVFFLVLTESAYNELFWRAQRWSDYMRIRADALRDPNLAGVSEGHRGTDISKEQ